MTILGAFVAAFALGSIPFGFLLVGAAGRGDIRRVGSGNIGATNVGRLLGPWGWTATLLADAAKGALGVALGGWLAGGDMAGMSAGAAGAVLGHCYTPWLRGKGGKGVATMIGAFAVLAPISLVIGMAAFALVVAGTRYVSLASLVAAVTLPLASLLRGEPRSIALAAAAVAVVVFVRHGDNVRRLLAGTEARVGARKEAGP